MKRDEAMQITEQSLAQLNESLKNGKSESYLAYLDTIAKFPHYSFRNLLLIEQQFPTATQVAGYNAWRKLGRWVKEGESGIGIIAPLAIRAKNNNEDAEVFGFRIVHVFDVSQTDGATLPSLARASGDPLGNIRFLEMAYSKLGIHCELVDLPSGHFGTSRGGHVQINSELTAAERFQTMVHELAHELLHTSPEIKIRVSKQVEELEAESVAYVVSQAYGVDCRDASLEYIHLYQGDEELLANSMERIRKTAVSILTHLSDAKETHESPEVSYAA